MKRVALALVCACKREPVTSCADDLGGIWEADSASWHVLDDGRSVELDPLFPDAPDGASPRIADLVRDGDRPGLTGTLHRNYTQRAATCDSRAPIRVVSCRDDVLEIVLSDPSPPLSFSPCTWPRTSVSRVERWHRR